jgi:hypothetical protein
MICLLLCISQATINIQSQKIDHTNQPQLDKCMMMVEDHPNQKQIDCCTMTSKVAT